MKKVIFAFVTLFLVSFQAQANPLYRQLLPEFAAYCDGLRDEFQAASAELDAAEEAFAQAQQTHALLYAYFGNMNTLSSHIILQWGDQILSSAQDRLIAAQQAAHIALMFTQVQWIQSQCPILD